MTEFLKRHWFLTSLAVIFGAGMLFPDGLEPLTRMRAARDWIVASVLFMTTLPLPARQIAITVRRPLALLLGVLVNFGLLPLCALLIAPWMEGEFAIGLIVAASAPCTIASAAVWTRRAGGNDVVAIMVTVITNLLCFVVTPLWIAAGSVDQTITMQPGPMIQKLALLVMLPMLLAQVCRQIKGVGEWTSRNKGWLSWLSQCGILAIILVGAVHCGLRLNESEVTGVAMSIAKMLLAVAGLHTSMLGVGFWMGRTVGLTRPDWIAVGFSGSQKTLMVGLQVALMLGGGMIILPMVAYHIIQLVVDTIVADRMALGGGPDDEPRSG